MNTKKIAILLLTITPNIASAQCTGTTPIEMIAIISQLQIIGNPIGFFMMAYIGIRWLMAEGVEDRENARRGVIYVVIGLILLRATVPLVDYLLC